MADKEVPNLFLILGIDPAQPWHQVEFERLLEEKRREWTRLVNRPDAKGREAQKNLNAIQDIKNVAADEIRRQEQAEAAKMFFEKERTAKLEQLDEDLRLLQAKGTILEDEFEKLLTRFKDIVNRQELLKRITVPIVRPEGPKKQPQIDALEPVLFKDINILLRQLNKQDLYDFLGLDENTATSQLHARAKSINKKIDDKGKKDAIDTFTVQLAGYCLRIFATDNERAKYTESCRMAAYDRLKVWVDKVSEFTKKVSAKEVNQILKAALQYKLDPDKALQVIQLYTNSKGIPLELPEGVIEPIKKMQRCGVCKHLNDEGKQNCVKCGTALFEPCPRCHKPVASDDSACGDCGFPIGNRNYVTQLLADAARLYQERDLDATSTVITQIHDAWPSSDKDEYGKRAKELEDRVKAERKKQEDALTALQDAIQKRHYYMARDLLPALQKAMPRESESVKAFEKKVAAQIKRAEEYVASARDLLNKGKGDEAVLAFQDALAVCRDYQEAREQLQRTPPSPPSAVTVTVTGMLIRLQWKASSSPQVLYTIVRKENSQPSSASDGLTLGTVAGLTYDDTSCKVGLPTYYAVFSNREDILSRTGGMLPNPILLVQAVEQLTAQVKDRQVELHWKMPDTTADVIVVRSDNGYPRTVSEGRRIKTLNRASVVDMGLINNKTYYYSVFAQYRAITGDMVSSEAAHIEAVPQAPPKPIDDLRFSKTGVGDACKLLIQWTTPTKGMAVILKAKKPIGLELGQILSQDALATFGQVLTPQGSQLIDTIDSSGYAVYYPIVLFQNTAYIGKECSFISVDDMRDLAVQKLGFALRLQWRWPATCNEALVAVNYQNWPDSTKANLFIPLTRAQYDINGFYDLTHPPEKDHYIAVFALYNMESQRVVSAGVMKKVRLSGRILLEYEIKVAMLTRKLTLEIRTGGKGSLPNLLIVKKRGTLPLEKVDGEVIGRVASRELVKDSDKILFPIDSAFIKPNCFIRLFLEDDQYYDDITIRHPSLDKLRLS